MNSGRSGLVARVNRVTLFTTALAGVVAGVAGALTDIKWLSHNILPILLFELSTLLAFVIVEFALLNDRVTSISSESGEVATFETRDSLYRAAAQAIRLSTRAQNAESSIWILSLTGAPSSRLAQPQVSGGQAEYEKELSAAMMKPGWSVRIIYNFDDLEHLGRVAQFLAEHDAAEAFEARAFIKRSGEILAPLIVGDRHVLIADGDRRYRGVRSGMHIVDGAANRFTRRYFDTVWQSSDLVTIRAATGIVESALQDVRAQLSAGGHSG